MKAAFITKRIGLAGLGLLAGLLLAELQLAIAAPRSGIQARQQVEEIETPLKQVVIIDVESGSTLLEKNASQPFFIGNLTKVMSASVVVDLLKSGKIKEEEVYKVSERAWRKGGGPSGLPATFVKLGSQVAVRDLLRGVMVQGGNDAILVLAEGTSGSEESFVRLMNRKAQELELANTRFTNSAGFQDPDHKTTAQDMAKLGVHVVNQPYYELYSEKNFEWNKINQPNRNALLGQVIGLDGMALGGDNERGYTGLLSIIRDDRRIVVALAGAESPRQRQDEVRRLADWAYRAFDNFVLFEKGEEVGTARVFGGVQGRVSLTAEKDVRVLMPRGTELRDFKVRIVYQGPLKAPLASGAEVASLQILRGSSQILQVPLVTREPVEQGTLTQRALDGIWELLVTRVFLTAWKKITG